MHGNDCTASIIYQYLLLRVLQQLTIIIVVSSLFSFSSHLGSTFFVSFFCFYDLSTKRIAFILALCTHDGPYYYCFETWFLGYSE